MTRLDWPALMRVGIAMMRLEPEVFWGLTPAEFQMMLGDPKASGPLLSTGLDALMAAYPDNDDKDDGNDG